MASQSCKKRSKNFSTAEVEILIEAARKNRSILFGPLQGPKMQKQRDCIWNDIVNDVNQVSAVRRTRNDLKKKFRDLKARTKQKAVAAKKAAKSRGIVVNSLLSDTEQKVIEFIDPEGIEEFCDVDPLKNLVGLENNEEENLQSAYFSSAIKEEVTVVEIDEEMPILPDETDKTEVLRREGIKTSIELQNETNELVRELISEFRDFKNQFLFLKKRELDLLERKVACSKQKR